MTLLSVAAFGVASWRAFFDGLDFTRRIVVERGAAGFEKIQSVFAGARLMGGDVATAYAVQTIATVAAIGALVWLWRSNADARAKIAATLVSTLLTTPYCLDYDMMTLAPALALLAALGRQKGFEPFEKSILALAFSRRCCAPDRDSNSAALRRPGDDPAVRLHRSARLDGKRPHAPRSGSCRLIGCARLFPVNPSEATSMTRTNTPTRNDIAIKRSSF